MSAKSFINMLIFMIAMQSGIVAADIHNVISDPSQDQHITTSALELNEELHESAHESLSADGCAYCMHCHCTHFIAIQDFNDIDVYPTPDEFYSIQLLTSLAKHPVSMFRPPKS
jgi:hypothetical protein